MEVADEDAVEEDERGNPLAGRENESGVEVGGNAQLQGHLVGR